MIRRGLLLWFGGGGVRLLGIDRGGCGSEGCGKRLLVVSGLVGLGLGLSGRRWCGFAYY